MAKNIGKVRGTKDVFPEQSFKWQKIESLFFKVTSSYGFREIRVPTFEYTEVFTRGIGDFTDIIDKEMYTFDDKGGRSLTLKPEGTSGVVRSVIESGIINNGFPLKLCYNTPCFRYDKPQQGRLREFHQFGVELFGSFDFFADIEVILIGKEVIEKAFVRSYNLEINSIGCKECRPFYNDKLKTFLKIHEGALCKDCKNRSDNNPLRVFDCKVESCKKVTKDAPKIIENLCNGCSKHFEGLKSGLESLGVKYVVNHKIVRGLDYYTKTVFEFTTDDLGAQCTICGGGRYDGLVELMGGKNVPAVGFGMGVERLLMLAEQNGALSEDAHIEVYLVNISAENRGFVNSVSYQLRSQGIKTECDLMERSVKSQMKYADKINAKYVIAIGEEEIKNKRVSIKIMATGESISTDICGIESFVKSRRVEDGE